MSSDLMYYLAVKRFEAAFESQEKKEVGTTERRVIVRVLPDGRRLVRKVV